jgi:VanZ family protein
MIKSCLGSCLLIVILLIALAASLLINSHNEVSKLTNPSQYENISDWISDMARFEWRYVMPGVK